MNPRRFSPRIVGHGLVLLFLALSLATAAYASGLATPSGTTGPSDAASDAHAPITSETTKVYAHRDASGATFYSDQPFAWEAQPRLVKTVHQTPPPRPVESSQSAPSLSAQSACAEARAQRDLYADASKVLVSPPVGGAQAQPMTAEARSKALTAAQAQVKAYCDTLGGDLPDPTAHKATAPSLASPAPAPTRY